ncbi:Polyketide cyclase / dehydrase and lipid transport [Nonomuraea maritima]|uniref:Polyketide cyclase / dehydrase and lipid transport n=1 Tax=Nonomuraea maritima TaxID=683260 RepID=A0A1G9ETU5_9ACTN|nr:SRPBCC family protein [Nonomuraea maritima]SDK79448.1 Polyketide cyclase / dehydrase and lipid transport [Nonomuraea maritima]
MGKPVYAAAAAQVDAPPEQVFALVTDWPRHREWMVLTTARRTGERTLEAFTGVGPFGFLDTMTITRWEPPSLVHVEHTGRLVRGRGVIRVRPHEGGSRIVWAEELLLPFGVLGRVGWAAARPFVPALLRLSLRRLAALAAQEATPGR